MGVVLNIQIRIDDKGMSNSAAVGAALEGVAQRFRACGYVETVQENPTNEITRAVIDGSGNEVGEFTLRDDDQRQYKKDLPDYGDLMTVDQWNESVENGTFTNDDGFGHWVKNNKESEDEVFSTPQKDATHVIWYNK